MNLDKVKIAVIGQVYVGLPLAIEFVKKYPTLGFDINVGRIDELKKGIDHTNEATLEQLKSANKLTFSANINNTFFINFFFLYYFSTTTGSLFLFTAPPLGVPSFILTIQN